MRLWLHFLKSDNSTAILLIKFGFVVEIRIQEEDSLIIWVGWLIIWL